MLKVISPAASDPGMFEIGITELNTITIVEIIARCSILTFIKVYSYTFDNLDLGLSS